MKAEYVDHMGSDLSVVNAARVSMEKQSDWEYVEERGTKKQTYVPPLNSHDWDYGVQEIEIPTIKRTKQLSEADTKLISYLAKHNHWTPFAHTSICLRMSAPVPIRTQCFKHKQGFVENEESRRYIKSTPELYVPDEFRMAADNVKQGSAGVHPKSDVLKRHYIRVGQDSIAAYSHMVERGVCPEQARFILPQGCMVNWIWTSSLAGFARFYKQRIDPHAQKEVQMLAEKVGEIIEPLFPVSWKALTNG